MRRVIALDIGKVRIGVAVSDPLGSFAQASEVLDAKDDWTSKLKDIVSKYDNPLILVGLPRRTDGTEGPEVSFIKAEAEKVLNVMPELEIEFWDERFTTSIAQRALLEADVSRKARKKKVDKIAAAVLLQSYLDRR